MRPVLESNHPVDPKADQTGSSFPVYHWDSMPRPQPPKPRFVGSAQMCPFPRRILIADHHTSRLPEVATALAAIGHTVFQTHDVVSTLETIQRRRPDLILLAPLGRNPEGPELSRILAAKNKVDHAPLVLIADDASPTESLQRLAGLVDDIVLRREATHDRLGMRMMLALGRLEGLRALEEEKLSLERQSITDFKTGTFNDRYFHRRLREEFSRARRHRTMISCLMLDFDNFKEINDNFDHAFGDFVLLAFARKLRAIIRDIDIPARFGGDEFVVLLPNTGLVEAVRMAERVRSIVGAYSFENRGQSTTVGLSLGISTFDGHEDTTPEEFLRRADCALLEAKRRGRNRVVLYPQVDDHPSHDKILADRAMCRRDPSATLNEETVDGELERGASSGGLA